MAQALVQSLVQSDTCFAIHCAYITLSSNKIQNGDIQVPANPGPPGNGR